MKLVLLALLYVISTTLSALPHTKTALDFINNEMQEVLEGSEGFLKDPVFPLSKTYDSLSESHEDAVLYFSKKHLNTVKRNEDDLPIVDFQGQVYNRNLEGKQDALFEDLQQQALNFLHESPRNLSRNVEVLNFFNLDQNSMKMKRLKKEVDDEAMMGEMKISFLKENQQMYSRRDNTTDAAPELNGVVLPNNKTGYLQQDVEVYLNYTGGELCQHSGVQQEYSEIEEVCIEVNQTVLVNVTQPINGTSLVNGTVPVAGNVTLNETVLTNTTIIVTECHNETITYLYCECPYDTMGDRCADVRPFSCSFEFKTVASSNSNITEEEFSNAEQCRLPALQTDPQAHLLSGYPICTEVNYDDNVFLVQEINCAFDEVPEVSNFTFNYTVSNGPDFSLSLPVLVYSRFQFINPNSPHDYSMNYYMNLHENNLIGERSEARFPVRDIPNEFWAAGRVMLQMQTTVMSVTTSTVEQYPYKMVDQVGSEDLISYVGPDDEFTIDWGAVFFWCLFFIIIVVCILCVIQWMRESRRPERNYEAQTLLAKEE